MANGETQTERMSWTDLFEKEAQVQDLYQKANLNIINEADSMIADVTDRYLAGEITEEEYNDFTASSTELSVKQDKNTANMYHDLFESSGINPSSIDTRSPLANIVFPYQGSLQFGEVDKDTASMMGAQNQENVGLLGRSGVNEANRAGNLTTARFAEDGTPLLESDTGLSTLSEEKLDELLKRSKEVRWYSGFTNIRKNDFSFLGMTGQSVDILRQTKDPNHDPKKMIEEIKEIKPEYYFAYQRAGGTELALEKSNNSHDWWAIINQTIEADAIARSTQYQERIRAGDYTAPIESLGIFLKNSVLLDPDMKAELFIGTGLTVLGGAAAVLSMPILAAGSAIAGATYLGYKGLQYLKVVNKGRKAITKSMKFRAGSNFLRAEKIMRITNLTQEYALPSNWGRVLARAAGHKLDHPSFTSAKGFSGFMKRRMVMAPYDFVEGFFEGAAVNVINTIQQDRNIKISEVAGAGALEGFISIPLNPVIGGIFRAGTATISAPFTLGNNYLLGKANPTLAKYFNISANVTFNPRTLGELKSLEAKKEKFDQAVESFDFIVGKNPGDVEGMSDLDFLYESTEDYKKTGTKKQIIAHALRIHLDSMERLGLEDPEFEEFFDILKDMENFKKAKGETLGLGEFGSKFVEVLQSRIVTKYNGAAEGSLTKQNARQILNELSNQKTTFHILQAAHNRKVSPQELYDTYLNPESEDYDESIIYDMLDIREAKELDEAIAQYNRDNNTEITLGTMNEEQLIQISTIIQDKKLKDKPISNVEDLDNTEKELVEKASEASGKPIKGTDAFGNPIESEADPTPYPLDMPTEEVEAITVDEAIEELENAPDEESRVKAAELRALQEKARKTRDNLSPVETQLLTDISVVANKLEKLKTTLKEIQDKPNAKKALKIETKIKELMEIQKNLLGEIKMLNPKETIHGLEFYRIRNIKTAKGFTKFLKRSLTAENKSLQEKININKKRRERLSKVKKDKSLTEEERAEAKKELAQIETDNEIFGKNITDNNKIINDAGKHAAKFVESQSKIDDLIKELNKLKDELKEEYGTDKIVKEIESLTNKENILIDSLMPKETNNFGLLHQHVLNLQVRREHKEFVRRVNQHFKTEDTIDLIDDLKYVLLQEVASPISSLFIHRVYFDGAYGGDAKAEQKIPKDKRKLTKQEAMTLLDKLHSFRLSSFGAKMSMHEAMARTNGSIIDLTADINGDVNDILDYDINAVFPLRTTPALAQKELSTVDTSILQDPAKTAEAIKNAIYAIDYLRRHFNGYVHKGHIVAALERAGLGFLSVDILFKDAIIGVGNIEFDSAGNLDEAKLSGLNPETENVEGVERINSEDQLSAVYDTEKVLAKLYAYGAVADENFANQVSEAMAEVKSRKEHDKALGDTLQLQLRTGEKLYEGWKAYINRRKKEGKLPLYLKRERSDHHPKMVSTTSKDSYEKTLFQNFEKRMGKRETRLIEVRDKLYKRISEDGSIKIPNGLKIRIEKGEAETLSKDIISLFMLENGIKSSIEFGDGTVEWMPANEAGIAIADFILQKREGQKMSKEFLVKDREFQADGDRQVQYNLIEGPSFNFFAPTKLSNIVKLKQDFIIRHRMKALVTWANTASQEEVDKVLKDFLGRTNNLTDAYKKYSKENDLKGVELTEEQKQEAVDKFFIAQGTITDDIPLAHRVIPYISNRTPYNTITDFDKLKEMTEWVLFDMDSILMSFVHDSITFPKDAKVRLKGTSRVLPEKAGDRLKQFLGGTDPGGAPVEMTLAEIGQRYAWEQMYTQFTGTADMSFKKGQILAERSFATLKGDMLGEDLTDAEKLDRLNHLYEDENYFDYNFNGRAHNLAMLSLNMRDTENDKFQEMLGDIFVKYTGKKEESFDTYVQVLSLVVDRSLRVINASNADGVTPAFGDSLRKFATAYDFQGAQEIISKAKKLMESGTDEGLQQAQELINNIKIKNLRNFFKQPVMNRLYRAGLKGMTDGINVSLSKNADLRAIHTDNNISDEDVKNLVRFLLDTGSQVRANLIDQALGMTDTYDTIEQNLKERTTEEQQALSKEAYDYLIDPTSKAKGKRSIEIQKAISQRINQIAIRTGKTYEETLNLYADRLNKAQDKLAEFGYTDNVHLNKLKENELSELMEVLSGFNNDAYREMPWLKSLNIINAVGYKLDEDQLQRQSELLGLNWDDVKENWLADGFLSEMILYMPLAQDTRGGRMYPKSHTTTQLYTDQLGAVRSQEKELGMWDIEKNPYFNLGREQMQGQLDRMLTLDILLRAAPEYNPPIEGYVEPTDADFWEAWNTESERTIVSRATQLQYRGRDDQTKEDIEAEIEAAKISQVGRGDTGLTPLVRQEGTGRRIATKSPSGILAFQPEYGKPRNLISERGSLFLRNLDLKRQIEERDRLISEVEASLNEGEAFPEDAIGRAHEFDTDRLPAIVHTRREVDSPFYDNDETALMEKISLFQNLYIPWAQQHGYIEEIRNKEYGRIYVLWKLNNIQENLLKNNRRLLKQGVDSTFVATEIDDRRAEYVYDNLHMQFMSELFRLRQTVHEIRSYTYDKNNLDNLLPSINAIIKDNEKTYIGVLKKLAEANSFMDPLQFNLQKGEYFYVKGTKDSESGIVEKIDLPVTVQHHDSVMLQLTSLFNAQMNEVIDNLRTSKSKLGEEIRSLEETLGRKVGYLDVSDATLTSNNLRKYVYEEAKSLSPDRAENYFISFDTSTQQGTLIYDAEAAENNIANEGYTNAIHRTETKGRILYALTPEGLQQALNSIHSKVFDIIETRVQLGKDNFGQERPISEQIETPYDRDFRKDQEILAEAIRLLGDERTNRIAHPHMKTTVRDIRLKNKNFTVMDVDQLLGESPEGARAGEYDITGIQEMKLAGIRKIKEKAVRESNIELVNYIDNLLVDFKNREDVELLSMTLFASEIKGYDINEAFIYAASINRLDPNKARLKENIIKQQIHQIKVINNNPLRTARSIALRGIDPRDVKVRNEAIDKVKRMFRSANEFIEEKAIKTLQMSIDITGEKLDPEFENSLDNFVLYMFDAKEVSDISDKDFEMAKHVYYAALKNQSNLITDFRPLDVSMGIVGNTPLLELANDREKFRANFINDEHKALPIDDKIQQLLDSGVIDNEQAAGLRLGFAHILQHHRDFFDDVDFEMHGNTVLGDKRGQVDVNGERFKLIVRSDQKGEQLVETLLHEIAHIGRLKFIKSNDTEYITLKETLKSRRGRDIIQQMVMAVYGRTNPDVGRIIEFYTQDVEEFIAFYVSHKMLLSIDQQNKQLTGDITVRSKLESVANKIIRKISKYIDALANVFYRFRINYRNEYDLLETITERIHGFQKTNVNDKIQLTARRAGEIDLEAETGKETLNQLEEIIEEFDPKNRNQRLDEDIMSMPDFERILNDRDQKQRELAALKASRAETKEAGVEEDTLRQEIANLQKQLDLNDSKDMMGLSREQYIRGMRMVERSRTIPGEETSPFDFNKILEMGRDNPTALKAFYSYSFRNMAEKRGKKITENTASWIPKILFSGQFGTLSFPGNNPQSNKTYLSRFGPIVLLAGMIQDGLDNTTGEIQHIEGIDSIDQVRDRLTMLEERANRIDRDFTDHVKDDQGNRIDGVELEQVREMAFRILNGEDISEAGEGASGSTYVEAAKMYHEQIKNIFRDIEDILVEGMVLDRDLADKDPGASIILALNRNNITDKSKVDAGVNRLKELIINELQLNNASDQKLDAMVLYNSGILPMIRSEVDTDFVTEFNSLDNDIKVTIDSLVKDMNPDEFNNELATEKSILERERLNPESHLEQFNSLYEARRKAVVEILQNANSRKSNLKKLFKEVKDFSKLVQKYNSSLLTPGVQNRLDDFREGSYLIKILGKQHMIRNTRTQVLTEESMRDIVDYKRFLLFNRIGTTSWLTQSIQGIPSPLTLFTDNATKSLFDTRISNIVRASSRGIGLDAGSRALLKNFTGSNASFTNFLNGFKGIIEGEADLDRLRLSDNNNFKVGAKQVLLEQIDIIQRKYQVTGGIATRSGYGMTTELVDIANDATSALYGPALPIATLLVEGTATTLGMALGGEGINAFFLPFFELFSSSKSMFTKEGRENRRKLAAETAWYVKHIRNTMFEIDRDLMYQDADPAFSDKDVDEDGMLLKGVKGAGKVVKRSRMASNYMANRTNIFLRTMAAKAYRKRFMNLINSGLIFDVAKAYAKNIDPETGRVKDFETREDLKQFLKEFKLTEVEFVRIMIKNGLFELDTLNELKDMINSSDKIENVYSFHNLEMMVNNIDDRDARILAKKRVQALRHFEEEVINLTFVDPNAMDVLTQDENWRRLFFFYRSYNTLFAAQRVFRDANRYNPIVFATRMIAFILTEALYMMTLMIAGGQSPEKIAKRFEQDPVGQLAFLASRLPMAGYMGEVAMGMSSMALATIQGKNPMQEMGFMLPISIAGTLRTGFNPVKELYNLATGEGVQKKDLAQMLRLLSIVNPFNPGMAAAAYAEIFAGPISRGIIAHTLGEEKRNRQFRNQRKSSPKVYGNRHHRFVPNDPDGTYHKIDRNKRILLELLLSIEPDILNKTDMINDYVIPSTDEPDFETANTAEVVPQVSRVEDEELRKEITPKETKDPVTEIQGSTPDELPEELR